MGLVPQCSSRPGASTDMQYDLLRSQCDIYLVWPEVNFKIGLSMITNIRIDPAWREEHDGVKIIPLAWVVEKLFTEKNISEERDFDLWWGLVLTVLGWPPIWGHRWIAEIQGYHFTILLFTSTSMTYILKVVCRLALAIWSYWYGCRERIFLNISKASNPLKTP